MPLDDNLREIQARNVGLVPRCTGWPGHIYPKKPNGQAPDQHNYREDDEQASENAEDDHVPAQLTRFVRTESNTKQVYTKSLAILALRRCSR